MNRNSLKTLGATLAGLPLFIFVAWASLAPAVQQTTRPQDASLLAGRSILVVDDDHGRSNEQPRLLEEECPDESEHQPVDASAGAAPSVPTSCSTAPERFFFSIESCTVSSALPRGPPRA